jgi:putative intracellular protease/amidase
MKAKNCLLITTSNNRLGDSLNKTGAWLEDLAEPYYVFRDAGEYITIASSQGGQVPLDLRWRPIWEEGEDTKRFLADSRAMYHCSHALPLKEVRADNFDLVFVVGGYAAMWDFPRDEGMKVLLERFIAQGKPIGLVGHAVAALVALTAISGSALVKGRSVTGFSNREEKLSAVGETLPFLLETELRSLGADYRSGADFSSYVVVDGDIITGQNPGSAVETATRLLEWVHQSERSGEGVFENNFSHNGTN